VSWPAETAWLVWEHKKQQEHEKRKTKEFPALQQREMTHLQFEQ
jgi:hypothetical protein